MSDILYKNDKQIEAIRKYLYSNVLREDEINNVISSALNSAFLKGVDAGCIIQRNNTRRIKNAIESIKARRFNEYFNAIEDKIYNIQLEGKK